MSRRLAALAALSATLVLAGASVAKADVTLGTTTFPSGSIGGNLQPGHFVFGLPSTAAISYTVPANGGAITSWSVNTLTGTANAQFSFFVARGSKIVVLDSRTLPSPAPPSHIQVYPVATPFVVAAGDHLGVLRAPGATGTFGDVVGGGSTPPDQLNAFGTFAGAPAVGGDLTTTTTASGALMIFSAVVRQAVNVRATGAVSPAKPVVGQLMLLTGTVANAGPSTADLAVTDAVPGGLRIVSALSGGGGCAVAGQFVTCPVRGLAPGGSAPVVIVARPTVARTYGNTMAAAGSLPDTSPGNDTVSTSFTVRRAPAKVSCVVPALAGLKRSTAERLLKLTNCRTGKIRRRHSRTVRSGRVISSSPRALSRRAKNAKVGLVVSSGPPPKKRR